MGANEEGAVGGVAFGIGMPVGLEVKLGSQHHDGVLGRVTG